jgi:exonuclease III
MPVNFPNISISSVNCNSLNISSIGSFNQKLKIYSIVSLKTDIIIMSDIRLCNAQGVSSSGEMVTSFRITPYGSYEFFYNSNLNKSGVGILIESTASISVLQEWRDGHDNILGLQLEREGKKFNLIAIYGPNHVQANFFLDIRSCIAALGTHPLVMGGDWNCTYSTSPPATNIDIFKMSNPPNLNHSKLLKKLCDDLELCDPFRTKYPNRLEFTYRPSNAIKKNRSRIDFFIMSCNLFNLVTDIENKSSLQNKLFDHVAIKLSFIPKCKAPTPPTISKLILDDPDLDRVVSLAVADTYLIHSSVLAVYDRLELQRRLGTAKNTLRECGPDSAHLPPGLRCELDENIRAANIALVNETVDSLPLAALQHGGFHDDTPPDVFMEALVNNIRNEVISHQIFIKKQINKTVDKLEKNLSNLKTNFHANSERINELEVALNALTDKFSAKNWKTVQTLKY